MNNPSGTPKKKSNKSLGMRLLNWEIWGLMTTTRSSRKLMIWRCWEILAAAARRRRVKRSWTRRSKMLLRSRKRRRRKRLVEIMPSSLTTSRRTLRMKTRMIVMTMKIVIRCRTTNMILYQSRRREVLDSKSSPCCSQLSNRLPSNSANRCLLCLAAQSLNYQLSRMSKISNIR